MVSIRSSFLKLCYQIFHYTQFWFLNINLKFHAFHASTSLSLFKLEDCILVSHTFGRSP